LFAFFYVQMSEARNVAISAWNSVFSIAALQTAAASLSFKLKVANKADMINELFANPCFCVLPNPDTLAGDSPEKIQFLMSMASGFREQLESVINRSAPQVAVPASIVNQRVAWRTAVPDEFMPALAGIVFSLFVNTHEHSFIPIIVSCLNYCLLFFSNGWNGSHSS
jgi:hypothetical protein